MRLYSAIVAVICAGATLAGTTPAAANQGLQELSSVAPLIKCADLQRVDVSKSVGASTRVTSAVEVRSGQSMPYCKVEGVIDPQIRFEVRLPVNGWTQRYLQLGCGGLCGSLDIRVEHARGCVPVDRGEIVLASTDMGHSGRGGAWAAQDPGARADFGYRGVHLTAVAAKALITSFYGRAPRYSYFSGCSDGGREGLIEAQRFPDDFNGIATGAPALNFTVQNSFYHAWNALSNTSSSGAAILTADKLPILHDAALKICDAADGLKDGLISDPRRCQFDPAVTTCKPGVDSSHCLSASEAEVARKIYDGAHDAQGRRLVISGPMPGSELAWAGVFVPEHATDPIPSAGMATESVKYLYFDAPLADSWSIKDLKFDASTLDSFKLRGLYDATNPDLSRYRGRGGKLLLWHGWSDPHISPLNSIAYLTALEHRFGQEATTSFARLFLFPGMYHCFDGEGPFEFDVLTPLMQWVEANQAPTEIVGTQLDLPPRAGPQGPPPADAGQTKPSRPFKVARTRPAYPYPAVTTFVGQGDVNNAANFRATIPEDQVKPHLWLGEKFFSPGYELECVRAPGDRKCTLRSAFSE
jgi:feruloyl esterase